MWRRVCGRHPTRPSPAVRARARTIRWRLRTVRRPPRGFRKRGPRPPSRAPEVRPQRLDRLRAEGYDALLASPCRGPARCPREGRRPPRPARTARPRGPRSRRGPPGSPGRGGSSRRRRTAGGRAPRSGRSAGGPAAAPGGSASAPRGPGSPGRARAGPGSGRSSGAWRGAARWTSAPARARGGPRGTRGATRASASVSAPSPRRSRKRDAVQEVGPVAADGVLRGRPLRRQVPEERRDGGAALLAAGRLHALSVSRR